jgi:dipeptidyl aminopeptidase/acylaminoacyl peptidase
MRNEIEKSIALNGVLTGYFVSLRDVAANACTPISKYLVLLAIAGFVLLYIAGSKPVHAQTKRGITPEDYFAFEFISDPQLAPDGKEVAYVLTTINQKENRRESAIWLIAADGSAAPRRLSAEGFNATRPRWSPDGKTLAFLSTCNSDPSTGGAKPQIYLLPIRAGGDAMALTTLQNGAESYAWSPDGTRMVAISRSGYGYGIAAKDPQSDVRHYKHTIYQFNDTGWDDGKRRHLWVVNVHSGEAKQITDGRDWNDDDPQWSPDGKRIAFVSDRTGKEYDGSQNKDIWVIPATGGALTKISDHDFEDESPRWSPDGSQILFTGETSLFRRPKLYVADSSGGRASRLVDEDLDLIPAELHWAAPHAVMFTAKIKGERQIFRVDPLEHTFTPVTSGPRAIEELDVNERAGKLVYLVNDFEHLNDLYVANLDGTGERTLTHLNTALWTQLELQPVEHFTYKSTDGLPIEGFFVKPLGWQAGKKYPMILVVHGGPEDMFGVGWHQEFQVYAAKGWAVFFCNPRGSIGYGEKFERGIINNWGGMDYQDIMAGVDAALKRYPWIDANDLGVTGGSYGGFMTNWIVSHTTRFKAAVPFRAHSNMISDDATRYVPFEHQKHFKGILYDDFEQYWEASPLKYAKNVRTPSLLLQCDMDFDVPLSQAEEWFRALQHFGVPSEIVMFPRENHHIMHTGEPKHIVETFNWRLYWFDRYLNGNPNAKPPDAR